MDSIDQLNAMITSLLYKEVSKLLKIRAKFILGLGSSQWLSSGCPIGVTWLICLPLAPPMMAPPVFRVEVVYAPAAGGLRR